MRTLVLTLTVACLAATSAHAQQPVYNKNPKAFVPKGYEILQEEYGDLTGDGVDDCVLVIREKDKKKILSFLLLSPRDDGSIYGYTDKFILCATKNRKNYTKMIDDLGGFGILTGRYWDGGADEAYQINCNDEYVMILVQEKQGFHVVSKKKNITRSYVQLLMEDEGSDQNYRLGTDVKCEFYIYDGRLVVRRQYDKLVFCCLLYNQEIGQWDMTLEAVKPSWNESESPVISVLKGLKYYNIHRNSFSSPGRSYGYSPFKELVRTLTEGNIENRVEKVNYPLIRYSEIDNFSDFSIDK